MDGDAVEFLVLGDVELRVGGRAVDIGHARQRCVLSALLTDPNRTVGMDEMLYRAWGERVPHQARSTLYGYLSRLRQALAGGSEVAIMRQPGGYRLTVDPLRVDLHRFRELVRRARSAPDDEALRLFETALALWRGDAFGMLDTPWLDTVREGLRRERLAAVLDRNELGLARGWHAAVVDELATCAADQPFDERVAGQLVLALYRCGRQAEALQTYDRLRRRVADELGVDLSPALKWRHHQILTADPALGAPAGDGAVVGGPASPRHPSSPVPLQVAAPAPAQVAPPVAPLVPRQLPARPGSFLGREAELAELDRSSAAQGAKMAISVITGRGGVGKTWLALRWAYDNLDRFPDGQLHVNLRGFEPAGEPLSSAVAIAGFLSALGVPPGMIPADSEARAGLYRSLLADKRMLIVLDNARDSGQVTPLLPGSPTSAVLVTSRNQLTGLMISYGARPLTLGALAPPEAHALLESQLGADRVAAEPDAIATVLRWCEGLPLALGIVSARTAGDPARRVGRLAAELEHAPTRLEALDAGEPDASLRVVLFSSVQALTSEAAALLARLSLASEGDLSLATVARLAALPASRARVLLRQLIDAHLLRERVPGRYAMPDLVRLYAAGRARREPVTRAVA